MDAARAADLPAPEVVRRAVTSQGEFVLLTWLPGTSVLEAIARSPGETKRWGYQMGALQRRLHAVTPPSTLVSVADDTERPFGVGRDVAGLPAGGRLLHLDWHPLNLLVDAAGTISGIVDWDNARIGHPSLDLARTRSILTLEPSLAELPAHVRHRVRVLLDAWSEGYGPEAQDVPHASEEWAVRVMLADLEPRYGHRPAVLDAVRKRLAALKER